MSRTLAFLSIADKFWGQNQKIRIKEIRARREIYRTFSNKQWPVDLLKNSSSQNSKQINLIKVIKALLLLSKQNTILHPEIVDRMNLLQRIEKIYHKLIVVKKLAWFIVNFVSMMPPFKHMRNMMEKMGQRAKWIHEKIVRFGRQKIPLAFLFQVEAQMQIVFLLAVVAIIYLYFKYFNCKSCPKDQKQQSKSKISRQLDELSQKTIEPPKRKIQQQKQEIDSCYEQLHNGLKQKPANQDRVFLAILERYQSMRYQNEEQEADHDRMSKNNKITQDNSTEEGNIKTSLRRIPTSPTNRKEADELNRSSVL